MKLSKNDLATILAALRYWQRMEVAPKRRTLCPEMELILKAEGLRPLVASEIDALCEELNTPEPPEPKIALETRRLRRAASKLCRVAETTTADLIGFNGADALDKAIDATRSALKSIKENRT